MKLHVAVSVSAYPVKMQGNTALTDALHLAAGGTGGQSHQGSSVRSTARVVDQLRIA